MLFLGLGFTTINRLLVVCHELSGRTRGQVPAQFLPRHQNFLSIYISIYLYLFTYTFIQNLIFQGNFPPTTRGSQISTRWGAASNPALITEWPRPRRGEMCDKGCKGDAKWPQARRLHSVPGSSMGAGWDMVSIKHPETGRLGIFLFMKH